LDNVFFAQNNTFHYFCFFIEMRNLRKKKKISKFFKKFTTINNSSEKFHNKIENCLVMNMKIEGLPFVFSMTLSEAETYKHEKEAFVSGFNGSTIQDVFLICFIIPVNPIFLKRKNFLNSFLLFFTICSKFSS